MQLLIWGVAVQAERAVEACCLRVDKATMTTFCRLVTQGSMDESIAELLHWRQSKGSVPSSSSHASSGGGAGSDASCSDMISAAVRAEVLRHHPSVSEVARSLH